MERYYTDKGFISKGATLNIQDTDSKFFMLLPVVDMPETKGAPSTQAKTVLSDESVTETEGLQTNDQKTYTFNYHRDNIAQLEKYVGKSLTFLERNPDNTGEKYTGTMRFGRSGLSVDGIVQGQIFITVSSAEEFPINDVRDIMKKTAIITTPLVDIELTAGNTYTLALETSEDATVTASTNSSSIATASIDNGVLTITAVGAGNGMITLETSATNEATSYRTIAVSVNPASEPVSYTITFDKNGGSGSMADVTVTTGSYELPACTFTAPTGKTFDTWTVGGVSKAVGAEIEVTGDTTVVATWKNAE